MRPPSHAPPCPPSRGRPPPRMRTRGGVVVMVMVAAVRENAGVVRRQDRVPRQENWSWGRGGRVPCADAVPYRCGGRDDGTGNAGGEAPVQRDSGSTGAWDWGWGAGGSAAARRHLPPVRLRPSPLLHLLIFRITRWSGAHRPSPVLPTPAPSHPALRSYPSQRCRPEIRPTHCCGP
ncbi:hypothetical protein FIBSPDRAFT_250323 [Athelia psychrophila]|uniref:Uncharacterized protein n=1 Tax=Athelia psychrophila TaxID=1759441 RepID=A0A165XWW0_9AGAM|nr:hypothetical protein FIBSPDRAFT_250323 [Fibularhizoctonia sp. CBS 109695]